MYVWKQLISFMCSATPARVPAEDYGRRHRLAARKLRLPGQLRDGVVPRQTGQESRSHCIALQMVVLPY